MGRGRENIVMNGKNYWILFDTGSRNNYIVKEATSSLPILKLRTPQYTLISGEEREITEMYFLSCFVHNLPITAYPIVVNELGEDEAHKKIEVLIGALTMQEWGIRPIPDEERLDMSYYPKIRIS